MNTTTTTTTGEIEMTTCNYCNTKPATQTTDYGDNVCLSCLVGNPLQTKYLIEILFKHNRNRFFKCINKGSVRTVKTEGTAKAFKTFEEASKFAEILFGLTMVSYKVVEIAK